MVGLIDLLQPLLQHVRVNLGGGDIGVAQELLDQLVDDASAAGVTRVTLEVRASNHTARKFYYKNNFIDIAIRKNYYRSPVEDAIVMYRVLPEDPSV